MKKHIRFLASALSLALALSLCAPALAAEGQYTANGESVPTIPAGANPEDYLTLNVQDLLDGAMDPDNIDSSFLVDGQAMIEEYRAAHPGELEALDINDLLKREGYPEPMEAYMEDYGYETEEEAEQALLLGYISNREWLNDIHAQADAYRAANPASWASFDPEAYLSEEWGWYTKEEYMEIYGLYTEEDFADEL